jgi:hypothetical protein
VELPKRSAEAHLAEVEDYFERRRALLTFNKKGGLK